MGLKVISSFLFIVSLMGVLLISGNYSTTSFAADAVCDPNALAKVGFARRLQNEIPIDQMMLSRNGQDLRKRDLSLLQTRLDSEFLKLDIEGSKLPASLKGPDSVYAFKRENLNAIRRKLHSQSARRIEVAAGKDSEAIAAVAKEAREGLTVRRSPEPSLADQARPSIRSETSVGDILKAEKIAAQKEAIQNGRNVASVIAEKQAAINSFAASREGKVAVKDLTSTGMRESKAKYVAWVKSNAKQNTELLSSGKLSDLSEFRRVLEADIGKLTDSEFRGILDAEKVGSAESSLGRRKTVLNYTPAQIDEKRAILSRAGLSDERIDRCLAMGRCGVLGEEKAESFASKTTPEARAMADEVAKKSNGFLDAEKIAANITAENKPAYENLADLISPKTNKKEGPTRSLATVGEKDKGAILDEIFEPKLKEALKDGRIKETDLDGLRKAIHSGECF